MHCGSRLSEGQRELLGPVAVLDSIHGAGIIASRLREIGIDAEALEVYHSSHEMERFSLVVAPVHLSPQNRSLLEARRLGKRVISHHRAVGVILGEREFRAVEITGTRGKTTTSLLLALILSQDMRVVSHTTSGIELWERGKRSLIRSGLSITPGNLIAAHQIASRERADVLVSEVSLGGTGAFDVGVITSLAGDYLIAGGSMWASTAKLQMLSLSDPAARIVVNADAKLSADITFGDGGDVKICRGHVEIRGDSLPLPTDESLDPLTYSDGIAGALATAISMDFDVQDAIDALDGFKGFQGRMSRYQLDGVSVIDNSNSGLNVSGVERALDLASGGRICLVAGEDSESVCEGLDIDAFVKMIESRRDEIDELVLVGKRLYPYALRLRGRTARNFQEGLEVARRHTSSGDHLVLCVKCFR